MPVAPPPNAVVYGNGKIKIEDMIRVGFLLNIVSLITTSFLFFLIKSI